MESGQFRFDAKWKEKDGQKHSRVPSSLRKSQQSCQEVLEPKSAVKGVSVFPQTVPDVPAAVSHWQEQPVGSIASAPTQQTNVLPLVLLPIVGSRRVFSHGHHSPPLLICSWSYQFRDACFPMVFLPEMKFRSSVRWTDSQHRSWFQGEKLSLSPVHFPL